MIFIGLIPFQTIYTLLLRCSKRRETRVFWCNSFASKTGVVNFFWQISCMYILLSKCHFQLISWYRYFQGLWYFQDIWSFYAGDLSHGAPLARVQPAHLWEVPPQVERDHPVTRLTMTRLDRVEMLKRVNRNFWEISLSPKKLRCDCRSRKRWCPLYANTLMRQ